jgi:hypothetical protein
VITCFADVSVIDDHHCLNFFSSEVIVRLVDVSGVKPLIHQSELRTYTKVVPFKEKSSFHFVVL